MRHSYRRRNSLVNARNDLRIGMLWIVISMLALITSGCRAEAQTLIMNPQEFPNYIDSVQPAPGRTLSLSNPEDRNLVYYPDEEARIICVHILIQPLLRPNDSFYQFENIELTVDGQIVTTEPSHEPVAHEAEGLEDEEGNVIAAGVESDTICWNKDISPGKHVATIQVWTSTGEEFSYSWAFKITR